MILEILLPVGLTWALLGVPGTAVDVEHLPAEGPAAGFEIVSIEERHVLTEEGTVPIRDIFIGGGRQQGLALGDFFDIHRSLEVSGHSMLIPVGRIKILEVGPDISVARTVSLIDAQDAPLRTYRPVMPGDLAVGVKVEKLVLSGDVLFEFDKATIVPGARGMLDETAAVIRDSGSALVIIEGHTDSVGSEKYNDGLSLRRAQAVRMYLIGHRKILPSMLVAQEHGESHPVSGNATAEGRSANRRVEIRILPVDVAEGIRSVSR